MDALRNVHCRLQASYRSKNMTAANVLVIKEQDWTAVPVS